MRSLLLPYCLLAVPATALNLQQNTALPCRLAASAAVDPQYAAVHTASRRGFGQHSLAWAAGIAAVVAPRNSGAWAVAPTEEEVAAAAKARNEEVKARLAAKAAADVAFRDGMQTTPRGLKFGVTVPPADPTSPTPLRGQSVRAEYTLSVAGFKGEVGAKVVDDSRGFMKAPFALYAGVGSQLLGKPFKALDLAVMDMRAGETRRAVAPPGLAFGANAVGLSVPENAEVFLEVSLLELGAEPLIDEEQEQWLRENPM